MYEGLPRQGYEQQLYELKLLDKRNKSRVTLQGFPFYKPPLEVSVADQETLKVLLGDERSFRQWGGEKFCDGFHPDYLAEWRVGGASYQFLICLGCGEVKAFGPDRSLRCDIETEAHRRIHEVLVKYVKNRPVQKGE